MSNKTSKYIVVYNNRVHHVVAESYEDCLAKLVALEGYSKELERAVLDGEVV
jgi:hypothetical protein